MWPFRKYEFKEDDVLIEIGGEDKWVVDSHSSDEYTLYVLPMQTWSKAFSQKYVESRFVKVGCWDYKKWKEVDDG